MSYRPFRLAGRFLLTACALSFGVTSLCAQSSTAPTGANPSRIDIFMGYSYFGAHGQLKPANIRYSSIDEGAMLSGAYYFNKYVGGEVISAYHPDGQNDGMYSVSAGPIFRAPMQNFTLFAHALAGAANLCGPNSDLAATAGHEPYRWGPSLTVGGGMDYDLPFFSHRFGLRLFQADYRYIHESYGPYSPVPTGNIGGRANLGAAELSTGILVHFGHIIPPPPVTYACSVTAPTGVIYPGDQVTITGTAGMLNPKKDAKYSWNSDSGAVSSTSNVVTIDTKALSAGTFTVKGHVAQGAKPGESADCSTTFAVKAYEPPTVGCSANPSTVNVGDSSTITANGVSPQNRPLTYSYSSTAGSVSGNTSSATLTTVGVAPGSITVTCNVVDDKGQTASQTTTITVNAPAAAVAPVAPATAALCTINFDRDAKRPARVDNEAKACLDDIALNAQRDPNAKLAITGSAASSEKHGSHVAAERAANTKAYLVTEKGVDASRITVYTGTSDGKTAATTLVPSGATLSTDGLTPVDESAVKVVPRSAPARKKK